MESKHTPGPWGISVWRNLENMKHRIENIPADEMRTVGIAYVENVADAERIIACINACEGIEDPSDLRKQRDELLEALEGADAVLKQVCDCGHQYCLTCAVRIKNRAAIAKAKVNQLVKKLGLEDIEEKSTIELLGDEYSDTCTVDICDL